MSYYPEVEFIDCPTCNGAGGNDEESCEGCNGKCLLLIDNDETN